MVDDDFHYRLEARIIDLENRVEVLEGQKAPEPALPQEVRNLIASGEHPVRAIRQYRLLTQSQLSEKCGIRPNHISAIERGQSFGLKTARRFAKALNVPADLLITNN